MTFSFSKYHGCGNDFVLIDSTTIGNNFSPKEIAQICDRNFGIGADGLIQIQKSENYDFKMLYFNSDGSMADFCGNGGRCIVAFAKDLNLIQNKCTFEAGDGIHNAEIETCENGIHNVKISMNSSQMAESIENGFLCYSGTEHFVLFVDDVLSQNVFENGRKYRYNPIFGEKGVNVNFAELKDSNVIRVRTYEKGVENETLACGTGAVAVAMAASNIIKSNNFIIEANGGTLEVSFDENGNIFKNIYLKGAAQHVFDGVYKKK